MADHTVTYDADQEKRVDKLLERKNAELTAAGESTLTKDEYIQAQADTLLAVNWRKCQRNIIREKSDGDRDTFAGIV